MKDSARRRLGKRRRDERRAVEEGGRENFLNETDNAGHTDGAMGAAAPERHSAPLSRCASRAWQKLLKDNRTIGTTTTRQLLSQGTTVCLPSCRLPGEFLESASKCFFTASPEDNSVVQHRVRLAMSSSQLQAPTRPLPLVVDPGFLSHGVMIDTVALH